jgi:hypothetical protein
VGGGQGRGSVGPQAAGCGDPFGSVVFGVGEVGEELAVAGIRTPAAPGGVDGELVGAERVRGADQAAQRDRVQARSAGPAQDPARLGRPAPAPG